jgi:hypothetical protein
MFSDKNPSFTTLVFLCGVGGRCIFIRKYRVVFLPIMEEGVAPSALHLLRRNTIGSLHWFLKRLVERNVLRNILWRIHYTWVLENTVSQLGFQKTCWEKKEREGCIQQVGCSVKLPSVVSFTQKFFVSRRRRVSIKVLYPEMSRIFDIRNTCVYTNTVSPLGFEKTCWEKIEKPPLKRFTTQLFWGISNCLGIYYENFGNFSPPLSRERVGEGSRLRRSYSWFEGIRTVLSIGFQKDLLREFTTLYSYFGHIDQEGDRITCIRNDRREFLTTPFLYPEMSRIFGIRNTCVYTNTVSPLVFEKTCWEKCSRRIHYTTI